MTKTLMIYIFTMFCSIQLAHGQKKKRLTKDERKLKQYELLTQAVRDTSFSFGTKEITMPFISSGMAGGGFLEIKNQQLQLHNVRWVVNETDVKNINDQVILSSYTYHIAQQPKISEVKFEGQVRETKYFFTINFGLGKRPTLTIINDQNHTVKYNGKMKHY